MRGGSEAVPFGCGVPVRAAGGVWRAPPVTRPNGASFATYKFTNHLPFSKIILDAGGVLG